MWTSSQIQKAIRITHLNYRPKKRNKQAYSLQKQCSFHIFLIGTGTDPCFRYRDGQEWQKSSPLSPKPYSLSHALCKSLVIMYHQTNLDYKSFSISEDCGFDLKHSNMIFLYDTLADDDASPY